MDVQSHGKSARPSVLKLEQFGTTKKNHINLNKISSFFFSSEQFRNVEINVPERQRSKISFSRNIRKYARTRETSIILIVKSGAGGLAGRDVLQFSLEFISATAIVLASRFSIIIAIANSIHSARY